MTAPNASISPATLRLPAALPSASQARAFVRRRAQEAGFDPMAVQDIEVAVGEAVSNAILHGAHHEGSSGGASETGGEITITVEKTGGYFAVSIQDHGPGFDLPAVEASTLDDLLAERGRGLALMGMLMDHLDMHRVAGGMVVRMERRLPGVAPNIAAASTAASPAAVPADSTSDAFPDTTRSGVLSPSPSVAPTDG
jgi:serine/threonine-protein kinase RsbW